MDTRDWIWLLGSAVALFIFLLLTGQPPWVFIGVPVSCVLATWLIAVIKRRRSKLK